MKSFIPYVASAVIALGAAGCGPKLTESYVDATHKPVALETSQLDTIRVKYGETVKHSTKDFLGYIPI